MITKLFEFAVTAAFTTVLAALLYISINQTGGTKK